MDYILNIHTSMETAIVSICAGNKILETSLNSDPKQHARYLHTAIHQILQSNDITPNQLKAVGVTAGPGSYTGIRVGLSTAKGLCYALNIPLITLNTLEVLALSAIDNIQDKNAFYCPMIDARRMEVFTAVYNHELGMVMEPSAMIVEENSFEDLLLSSPVYFFGNGSEKLKNISKKIPSSSFISQEINSNQLCQFTWKKYKENQFADVAYAEPLYIKEFYSARKTENERTI